MGFRERRLALGLAQFHIAERARMSQGAVSRVERGVASPNLIARATAALLDLERARGIRHRDLRLGKRREALGLSISDVAERAFFRVGCEAQVRMVEHGVGSAEEIQAVRRAILFEETEPRRKREERRKHDARIARQRALFAALPDGAAKDALQDAMLSRCLDLMFAGSGEETDAIAEWLPEAGVEAMFAEYDAWVDAGPRSDMKCRRCEPAPVRL